MGDIMTEDFPYLQFAAILKECRQQMIADNLNENPDLYAALYKRADSEEYKIYMQYYELKWLSLHWEKVLAVLARKDITIRGKRSFMILFADWYKEFLKQWQYTFMESHFFGGEIQALQELMVKNSLWEENIKRVRVALEKNKKEIQLKIEELKSKAERK